MPTGTTIRIMIYVDDDAFLDREPGNTKLLDFQTSLLQEALRGDIRIPIAVEVKARQKGDLLTQATLSPFHEVWFFVRQVEGADPPIPPLSDAEVQALLEWMNGGRGVLLAGDHAIPFKTGYKGLGAPVGRRVPRARHMRKWDSVPSTDPLKMSDIVADTTDHLGKGDPEPLEWDALPQRLLLARRSDDNVYSIFFGAGPQDILDRFPDHRHEGEVSATVNTDLTKLTDEWPTNRPPIFIIAKGVNWRHGRTNDLMAQWDGDKAVGPGGVRHGRILADSSFHHYVDANLRGIAASGGDVWAQIQQVFRNQALWLAPWEIRKEYQQRALRAVFDRYHDYDELAAVDLQEAGRRARRRLAEVLPAPWLDELDTDVLAWGGHGGLLDEEGGGASLRGSFGDVLLGLLLRSMASGASKIAEDRLMTDRIDEVGRHGVDVGSLVAQAIELHMTALADARQQWGNLLSRLKPAPGDPGGDGSG